MSPNKKKTRTYLSSSPKTKQQVKLKKSMSEKKSEEKGQKVPTKEDGELVEEKEWRGRNRGKEIVAMVFTIIVVIIMVFLSLEIIGWLIGITGSIGLLIILLLILLFL
jgi:uncharacterized membrane protein YkgB